jgi:hypothetical protein
MIEQLDFNPNGVKAILMLSTPQHTSFANAEIFTLDDSFVIRWHRGITKLYADVSPYELPTGNGYDGGGLCLTLAEDVIRGFNIHHVSYRPASWAFTGDFEIAGYILYYDAAPGKPVIGFWENRLRMGSLYTLNLHFSLCIPPATHDNLSPTTYRVSEPPTTVCSDCDRVVPCEDTYSSKRGGRLICENCFHIAKEAGRARGAPAKMVISKRA